MPRKTHVRRGAHPAAVEASMRPRPDAAENGECLEVLYRLTAASMRPRPDAAENATPYSQAAWLRMLQ